MRGRGLVCLLALVSLPARAAPHGEILWDSFGVPHVTAPTEPGLFYGFGYAQAHNHADLLLRLYGEARARGAEYFGAKGPDGIDYEAEDRWLIGNDMPERAQGWYDAQTPAFRADLDAFADGINAYAKAHPEAIDPKVAVVLPVSGRDVIAHALKLMNYVYIASGKKALDDPLLNTAGGSNAWAVAPSHTKDGHTLLLANPHLPWAPSQLTYTEAQLTGPGVAIYGATQVGLPVLRFGFNHELGFTNTVNDLLGWTSYRLTLTANGRGYVYDGTPHAFTHEAKSYRVRQPDGTLKTVSFTQDRALQGPVFRRGDGSAIAVRVAGLDRPFMLQQYWEMDRARNWTQFHAAVAKLQVPTFNIVYATAPGTSSISITGWCRAMTVAVTRTGCTRSPVIPPRRCGPTRWRSANCRRCSIRPRASCRMPTTPPGGAPGRRRSPVSNTRPMWRRSIR